MIYRKTPRTRLTKLGGSLFTIGFILASCCIAADPSTSQVIAQGGGTTIVQGGTGKAGGFIPVLTTIAFHAERSGTTITGGFECLARAPEKNTGSTSAQFTVNAMYVTGQIKNAVVQGTTATLTGTADITGLGVGSNIPFTLVVRQGGPGTTAVLTTEGTPQLIFNEILVEGDFRVFSGESNGN